MQRAAPERAGAAARSGGRRADPAAAGPSAALTTSDPLILTLGFHAENQARFDALRQAHFPAERNFIPAHLALFHSLPGDDLPGIHHVLAAVAGRQAGFMVEVTGLRSLGRGVAFVLGSPILAALRAALAREWHGSLTPQDRQGFRPHVTVQNKVSAAEASGLLAVLTAGFTPFTVRAKGLQLWHYRGGPWEEAGRYLFVGGLPCQGAPVRPEGPE